MSCLKIVSLHIFTINFKTFCGANDAFGLAMHHLAVIFTNALNQEDMGFW